jgi:hypothetical protein
LGRTNTAVIPRHDGAVVEQRTQSDDLRPREAQVLAFEGSYRRLHFRQTKCVNGWSIRPTGVIMLLPLIVPLVAAILLGLLGWFVAWLATIATLVAGIVFGDVVRGLWPRNRRALDRQPIG